MTCLFVLLSTGLRLALQRSKASGLFCRDVAKFLLGVATIYDQYGVNLVKLAQSIRPDRMPLEDKSILPDDFRLLYENLRSFGDRFRTMAEFFRTSIVDSVISALTQTSKTVDAAHDKYLRVRQDSFQSRQSALDFYNKYKSAVDAAEAEIQSWIKQCDEKAPEVSESNENSIEIVVEDTAVSWERSLQRLGSINRDGTSRLIQKLRDIQSCGAAYAEAVAKENKKVTLAMEMESVALEHVQETEQDRVRLFALTVVAKVFKGEIDVENMKLPTPSNAEASFAEGFEKKGKDILAGLNAGLFKQQSVSYEPGMGAMEAEIMGLPLELGTLRDNVRSSFTRHEVRIKATETLLKLMEEIVEVTNQSASALRIRTQAQAVNQAENATSGSAIGTRSKHLWLATVNTFHYEAKLISDVAFAYKKLKSSTLVNWVSNAPKILKNEMEMDDAAWKLVCDSARTEMKSESKYRQAKEKSVRARSRASSRGDVSASSSSNDSADQPSTPKRETDSHKAPGSSFRLFKGGSEAMKLFQEKALGQVAGDQLEQKVKTAFEDASAAKTKALMAYKAYTNRRIERLEKHDKEGWQEVQGIIGQLLHTTLTLEKARQETLQLQIREEIKNSFPLISADIDDWVATAKERLLQMEKTMSNGNSAVVEFSLSVKNDTTSNIQTLLGLIGSENAIPELERVMVEDSEDSPQKSIRSTSSFDSAASKRNETKPNTTPRDNTSVQLPDSKTQSQRDRNIEAFMKTFGTKTPEGDKTPNILEIFNCSYRAKDKSAFLFPNLHGRCFTTSDKLYFLALDNKHFVLKWDSIKTVERDRGFMGSASDNTIAITYSTGDAESTFTLSRLRDCEEILKHMQSLLGVKERAEQSGVSTRNELPSVPQDELLNEMEVVVSKTIKNVSIKDIFENVWADPPGKKSFYESWLEDEECFDITTGAWEFAGPNAVFSNPWCSERGETYTQKRLVTFKFKRTTHLYIGPPIAFVKQWHYIRMEGDDRIVLAIEASFEGIPYAETFGVEMRWIGRRVGATDVKVEVGLFVVFKKATMLKNQIKSGTISETKNVHVRLFNAIKKACSKTDDTQVEEFEEEVEEAKFEMKSVTSERFELSHLREFMSSSSAALAFGIVVILVLGRFVLNFAFGQSSGQTDIARLEMQIVQLQEEVRVLQNSVNRLVDLLNEKTS